MAQFSKAIVLSQTLVTQNKNIGPMMGLVTIFCNPSLAGRIHLIKECCQMLTLMVSIYLPCGPSMLRIGQNDTYLWPIPNTYIQSFTLKRNWPEFRRIGQSSILQVENW